MLVYMDFLQQQFCFFHTNHLNILKVLKKGDVSKNHKNILLFY